MCAAGEMRTLGIIFVLVWSLQSADDWYATGVRLANAGKSAEAMEAYRKAVGLDPRHVDAWNNLGDLLRRSGDPVAALDAFNRALGIDPHHARASLNAALVQIEFKQFKLALPLLETAHQGMGELPLFDYLFARVYLELNDYDSAHAYLVRFRQGKPMSPAGALELATLLMNRNDYAGVAEMLLSIPAPKMNLEMSLRLAQSWYGLDQLEKAKEILDELVKSSPADFAVFLWTGYVQRGLGNAEAAYAAFDQALKRSPNSGEALVALANLELERNAADEAVALAERALKTDAADAAALLVRGLAMIRLDRPAEAVKSLTEIRKDSGVYAQSLYPLSRAYRDLGQSDKADLVLQELSVIEQTNVTGGGIPVRKRP